MKFPGKNSLLTVGVAGIVALGATGIVMAQGPGTGSATTGEHSAAGPLRQRIRDHVREDAAKLIGLKGIVEASGLDAEAFKTGFMDGQTINQILAANGVDSAAVQSELLSNLQTKLAQLVSDGKIDQAKADEVLANAPARIAEAMDRVPDPENIRSHIGNHLKFRATRGVIESSATTLGLTPEELLQELRGPDTTIAAVAEGLGVAPQLVIDNAVADASARIDAAVAEGKLDAAKADELKANLEQRITAFVNEGRQRGQQP